MKNILIDKWESIPRFILNNNEILFNGIYVPKGSVLNVHSLDLIQFTFRGTMNPKILLRSTKWNLYELELIVSKYERVIPELDFSSTKLMFNDAKEKNASRRALEGIRTAMPIDAVKIVEFEVFYIKESGEENYTEYEFYDERDKMHNVNYQVDIDCGILIKLSNNKCVYMDYSVNHESYNVLFGSEELILNNAYLKTQWFDYPTKNNNIRNWKKRKI